MLHHDVIVSAITFALVRTLHQTRNTANDNYFLEQKKYGWCMNDQWYILYIIWVIEDDTEE